jgi:molybdenum cofactor biosynthesis protein B
MSVDEHRRRASRRVQTAVLTVSDTRTPETDSSGALIRSLLEQAGHRVVHHHIVRDEPDEIRSRLRESVNDGEVQAVLITGGTGLAPRDVTCEVVESLLDKRIDGFGELFRSLSFAEIGAAAMLSRATAGVCGATVVVAMPGSETAVRLAMTRLVLPELAHMVAQAGAGANFD